MEMNRTTKQLFLKEGMRGIQDDMSSENQNSNPWILDPWDPFLIYW